MVKASPSLPGLFLESAGAAACSAQHSAGKITSNQTIVCARIVRSLFFIESPFIMSPQKTNNKKEKLSVDMPAPLPATCTS
jgi:hypothetical protein